jgi:putative phosphoesterase
MKIGIISDTHGRSAGIDGALEIFSAQKVGLIVHCGDWAKPQTARYFQEKSAAAGIPVQGVLGNNDKDVGNFLGLNRIGFELSEGVLHLEIEGRRIHVYHGHHKPTLRDLLMEPVDLLCLGHSHKPRYDILDHQIIINPGSTAFAIPRSKTWQASVAIYDTGLHEAEFIYF